MEQTLLKKTGLSIKQVKNLKSKARERVERIFKTLQDRLVKELRLAGITVIEKVSELLLENLS